MNREQTLALYAQGKDAWNAWADKMLAEKKRLQAAGADLKAWEAEARADFSSDEDPHTFRDPVNCDGWRFPGDAGFRSATFSGNAGFSSATFSGNAGFRSATFSGYAVFSSATFSGYAWFDGATFSGYVGFDGATFSGYAGFSSATFSGYVGFDGATFSRYVGFDGATFSGYAGFDGATCSGNVGFDGATFSGYAGFSSATFSGYVGFDGATFEGFASFARAHFVRAVSFLAIKSTRAFTLEAADFAEVPGFIQANFAEAPRLDNVHIRRGLVEPGRFWSWPLRLFDGLVNRLFHGDADIPARYRALKRLAVQGHDGDREQMFFAGEITSARFAGDWPLPLTAVVAGRSRQTWKDWIAEPVNSLSYDADEVAKAAAAREAKRRRIQAFPLLWLPINPWRASAWAGFFRFWFGILYQLFSDFGRSVLRPLVVWLAAIAVTALFCLNQMPEIAARRAAEKPPTTIKVLESYLNAGMDAWKAGQACTRRTEIRDIPNKEGGKEPAVTITGLTPAAAADTSAVAEALHLAFRNAFIILDGGGDAAHRTFGCLYGLERYGDNPVPILPSSVSVASAIQKFVSAIMIFLFGLALRNMLKMK